MAQLIENADAIKEQARLFDDVRPSGARIFLLKHTEHSSEFESVREFASGWFVSFDKKFRDEMKIRVATNENLADEVAQSSFVGYGVGEPGDEIDVFDLKEKDLTRPNATSPSWKIYATRAAGESFVMPPEAE